MPLWVALARSLNTVATELSFAVGRDKVIEMTKRLGIKGVKKTCSMALGDGGLTVLEHTAGFATFDNDGKLATPYGILDITTSKGDLLYSRERDEPPAPQVISKHVAEEMNVMLNRVVTQGTARRADLDFTNVAGKTGTSTGPKDVWFMGFTGKYVGGVWIGNDDNHPMRAGTTGGHVAAPIWHDLMTIAHTDMNIRTIPGLAPHPRQVEEQQRLAALKAERKAAGLDQPESAKSEKIMPDKTRAALKTLLAALHKASSGDEVVPATPASIKVPAESGDGSHVPALPGAAPSPSREAPSARPDRRAKLFNMPNDDLTVPAVAPSPAPGSAAGAP
jgi:penicillin-binding protein 1A